MNNYEKLQEVYDLFDNAMKRLDQVRQPDPFEGLPKQCRIYDNRADNWWQLIELRDAWRKGADPKECRYLIIYTGNSLIAGQFTALNAPLSFPTEELMHEFLEHFKGLIVECKELLS